MFGFKEDKKCGKGVEKDDTFIGLMGFFKLLYIRFWDVVMLNFIFLLFCIPVVTIGPATAAMTSITKKFVSRRPVFLWQDFLEAFKVNFKQSFVMGLIDFVIAFLTVTSFAFYLSMENASLVYILMFAITIVVLFNVLIMRQYIYLMIVSTELTLFNIIKNSYILSIIEMKVGFISGAIFTICLGAIVAFFPLSIFIIVAGIFGFMSLISSYNLYSRVRRHIILPFYKNGEEVNEN